MSPSNSTAHSHSRTGSSPAMMTSPTAAAATGMPPLSSSQQSNKAARTHTYPKLPDKFKVRTDHSHHHHQQQQQQQQQPPTDEEVIYF